jgi:hypothetical protein
MNRRLAPARCRGDRRASDGAGSLRATRGTRLSTGAALLLPTKSSSLPSLAVPDYLPHLRHATVPGRRLHARPSPWRFPPAAPIQHTAGEFPAAERGVEWERS